MNISGLLETLQQMLEKHALFLHHMSLMFFSKSLCLRLHVSYVELPISSAVNHKIRLVRNPIIQVFQGSSAQ